jgi:uncharacterized protein (UPF0218 family)
MKKTHLLIAFVIFSTVAFAQTITKYSSEVEALKQKKEQVIKDEKEALKKQVIEINNQFNEGKITAEQATQMKEQAAEISALNIDNKLAIIDNEIALAERKGLQFKADDTEIRINNDPYKLSIEIFEGEESMVDINLGRIKKYDKRTHSNLVIAFGLNNAIIEGQSFNDSPYKVGKSKFFEMGWSWSTRVLEYSNVWRFRYGMSFQFNGLNPTDNQYFVQNGDLTTLEDYPLNLTKSKLRMDNLVVPLFFEFGPSKKIDHENYFRYSTRKMFKFGIGGYAGLNLGTRQKLKYTEDGDKEKDKYKQSYNTANFIYGVSSYIGVDDFSFYVKYDLNNIFNSPNPKENNISFGLRFDL